MNMTQYDITVAICTIGNRIFDITIPRSLPNNIKIKIFLQNPSVNISEYLGYPVNIVTGVGVNISRNIALKNCDTRFLYFMDDDLSVDFHQLNQYIRHVKDNCSSAPVHLHGVENEFGNDRKSYLRDGGKLKLKNIFRWGISEMLFEPGNFDSQTLLLTESFGAGTSLPIADEAILLSSLIRKGYVIKYHDFKFASHNTFSSGMVDDYNSWQARKLACILIFKRYGYLVYLALKVKITLRAYLR